MEDPAGALAEPSARIHLALAMRSERRDPSDVRIRPARLDDADAFADQRLHLFASQGDLSRGADLPSLRQETRAAFLHALAEDVCAAWLAVQGNHRIVGSAALVFAPRLPSLRNPTRTEAWLAHLFVEPDARRRGIGTALLHAALHESRRRGFVRLRLHATGDGRALYERFGFRLRTNDMELELAPACPP